MNKIKFIALFVICLLLIISCTNQEKPISSEKGLPEPPLKKVVVQKEIMHTIQILGDNECKQKTNAALTLLSTIPADYQKVISYINIIDCKETSSGMYPWEISPRFVVGKQTYTHHPIWYAGVIVHDACHSRQYSDYLAQHPGQSVPHNVFTGSAAEQECLLEQYETLTTLQAPTEYTLYLKEQMKTNYWEKPLHERWW
ncbi:hypothetical protein COV18_07630 [Candidatus Woesearchaeota archaeon CG10_big_fil_rev_8_21_14_0_10_37_12]|nr:MAG: hypothetical protein COV18_07630 [Candidatus Woesearchaeota archaeon CG10_big_fil_rev_8_21_14_0_10_37_12]